MIEKKTRFVFINDDKHARRQWLEWAKRKGHSAFAVDNAFEANNIAADYYVFDISAVAPGTLSSRNAYSPICKVAENNPGAIIVIVSAMGKECVQDVIDDVFDASGVRVIYGGWGTYADFEKAIKLVRTP